MTGPRRVAGRPDVRPATSADVPELTELYRAADVHWFGAAEHDEVEVQEELDRLEDLGLDTRLSFVGDQLVAAVLHGHHESSVLVRPGAASGAVQGDALEWLALRPPARVEVLDRDVELIAALTARHWQHAHSAFELSRPVSDGWPAADPAWPDGIVVAEARSDDLTAVHRLVYDEAGFGDVPGHVRRGFDEWHRLIVGDRPLGNVVLARLDERLVGASVVRVFSDGLGWISQLAVVPGERGHGLGRALVLESFRRLVAAGATSLGLGVSAANRGALTLYVSLGLAIDREWQLWDARRRIDGDMQRGRPVVRRHSVRQSGPADGGHGVEFVDVVAAEHAGLLRYATALAGDPDQAADMVQDVLTRAFQRWDAIATTDRPAAYLMTMVTNEFLSWRRRWSTRFVAVADDETLARVGPSSPGDHGERLAVRDDLERRLARLPRRQQAALVLRYYEGLDHDEAAAVLGCAPGTVRSLCSRGLAALRADDRPPAAPHSTRAPARLPATGTDSR